MIEIEDKRESKLTSINDIPINTSFTYKGGLYTKISNDSKNNVFSFRTNSLDTFINANLVLFPVIKIKIQILE
jgi:hypothetical protein